MVNWKAARLALSGKSSDRAEEYHEAVSDLRRLYGLVKRASLGNYDRSSGIFEEFYKLEDEVVKKSGDVHKKFHLLDGDHRRKYLFRVEKSYIRSMSDAASNICNSQGEERIKWINYLREHEVAFRKDVELIQFR